MLLTGCWCVIAMQATWTSFGVSTQSTRSTIVCWKCCKADGVLNCSRCLCAAAQLYSLKLKPPPNEMIAQFVRHAVPGNSSVCAQCAGGAGSGSDVV